MTADPGFGRGLGVVRAQVSPENYVVALPQPRAAAVDQADALVAAIAGIGDAADLVAFDIGDGLDACWIRARDVLTVDVVPTEDPSA